MTSETGDLDIRLSAYLDGELSEAEHRELEKSIAEDPAIAARLEELALATSGFEEASRDIDDIPMSASLTSLLDRLETDKETTPAFPGFLAPTFKVLRDHRAIAASVVVAAGAMTLQTAIPAQVASVDGLDGTGTIHADSRLGGVLEASSSGERVDLGKNVSATPRLTFASGDGFCRVLDLSGSTSSGRLVACRAEAAWQVTLAAFSNANEGSPEAPYRTASSAGPESIESYLDTAMTGAPLGQEAEADLIQSGWTSPAADEEE